MAFFLMSISLTGCGNSETSDETSSDATPTPAADAPITLEGTIELTGAKATIDYFDARADVEITDLTFNFWPTKSEPIFEPDDGNMFVRIGATVTNIGDEPFYFNTTAFSLNSSVGEGDYETFLIGDDIAPYGDIAVGESITTGIYYEVAETDNLDTLELVIEGADSEGGTLTTVLPLAQ
ncbi:MAG: DUF4352 domain-containing protein [bacterium]|nr:DUF4352 domain-containing protein [bacterium]